MIRGKRGGAAKRSEGQREAGWTRGAGQRGRRRYPDGFRHISGVLERLENWDRTLSL